MARPIHLGVIDGIKNAVGGEGPWNPTFQPAAFNLLLAGKTPVALDSVASHLMGNDPEADKFRLPGGEECDNYLKLANGFGNGLTNNLDEIQLVGDGVTTSVVELTLQTGRLKFNSSRIIRILLFIPQPIRYYLPRSGHITFKNLQ